MNDGPWMTCPAGTVTAVLRPPPARSTTSIRVLATTNAIRRPSGDQAGSYSSAAVSATAVICPEARSSRWMPYEPERSAENASRSPAGANRGSRWSYGPEVSCRRPDPSGRITHRSNVPVRYDWNAMAPPSGDQSGCAMSNRSPVSRRAGPPEAGSTHSTPTRSIASRRPSGDRLTATSVPWSTPVRRVPAAAARVAAGPRTVVPVRPARNSRLLTAVMAPIDTHA